MEGDCLQLRLLYENDPLYRKFDDTGKLPCLHLSFLNRIHCVKNLTERTLGQVFFIERGWRVLGVVLDMYLEITLIASLIAIFSFIQSIFGLGILVFGTPTLLLMGFGFSETLGTLLPSSMVISAMQIATPGIDRPKMPRELYFLCLPVIAASLWFSIATGFVEYTIMLVGGILLISGIARSVSIFQVKLAGLIKSNSSLYHLAMGAVHGLTNVGGALLAVFAASVYPTKEEMRYTIAYYYFAFGVLQCATLLLTFSGSALVKGVLLSVIAAIIYTAVGSPLFRKLRDLEYNRAMSVFIFAYGAILLGKGLV